MKKGIILYNQNTEQPRSTQTGLLRQRALKLWRLIKQRYQR